MILVNRLSDFSTNSIGYVDISTDKKIVSLSIEGNVPFARGSMALKCLATYDDDSTEYVTPTWQIVQGADKATINTFGVLSAVNDSVANAEVKFKAKLGSIESSVIDAIISYGTGLVSVKTSDFYGAGTLQYNAGGTDIVLAAQPNCPCTTHIPVKSGQVLHLVANLGLDNVQPRFRVYGYDADKKGVGAMFVNANIGADSGNFWASTNIIVPSGVSYLVVNLRPMDDYTALNARWNGYEDWYTDGMLKYEVFSVSEIDVTSEFMNSANWLRAYYDGSLRVLNPATNSIVFAKANTLLEGVINAELSFTGSFLGQVWGLGEIKDYDLSTSAFDRINNPGQGWANPSNFIWSANPSRSYIESGANKQLALYMKKSDNSDCTADIVATSGIKVLITR